MSRPIPKGLSDYLRTFLSPPEPYLEAVFIPNMSKVDWGSIADGALTGLLVVGTPDKAMTVQLLRVLKPGAHLMVVAPEDNPIGHKGAVNLEDGGFQVRDTFLVVDDASDPFHYMAKVSRAEREAGCQGLPEQTGAAATGRKEGSDGLKSPRAGASRTAQGVKNHHPCLHPDAFVMTEQGYRPISEVTLAHRVLGSDGRFHAIEDISHHPYTSDHLYEIAVQGTNYTTLASDNHPFLIWRPTRKGKNITGGNVGWVEAQAIRRGDYTMTPLLVDIGIKDDRPDEWWWVFGLWLAEGVLQRAGHGSNVYPSFTLHQDETDYINRLRRFFEGRGFNLGEYPKKGTKAVQVIGFDPEVGGQFREWSPCGASNKRLPPTIWQRQRSTWQAVFEGYMAGDGGKVRTYRQAKTVSPDLASQMRLLGEALGSKGNLHRYGAQPGKIGSRKFKETLPSYQMRFYALDREQERRKPTRPTILEHESVEYRLSYVQGITPTPYKGDVWNLTVRDCPTFQTAVGMSHNTVKPWRLMQTLLRDVPRGRVVDPFMGSGSTGVACLRTGHDFTGIDMTPEYVEISTNRIEHWDQRLPGYRKLDLATDQRHESEPDPEEPDLFDAMFGED
jgi:hypothetical protein